MGASPCMKAWNEKVHICNAGSWTGDWIYIYIFIYNIYTPEYPLPVMPTAATAASRVWSMDRSPNRWCGLSMDRSPNRWCGLSMDRLPQSVMRSAAFRFFQLITFLYSYLSDIFQTVSIISMPHCLTVKHIFANAWCTTSITVLNTAIWSVLPHTQFCLSISNDELLLFISDHPIQHSGYVIALRKTHACVHLRQDRRPSSCRMTATYTRRWCSAVEAILT